MLTDPNNFSCEQPTSAPNITTTNATVPDDDGSSIDGNSSNPNNASDNNSTMTNGTITNDISNPIVNDTSDDDDVNPVTDSPITPTPSPNPPNENPSNSTQGSSDDEGFLEKIESLPVPVIASIGAFILIMIIVVTILLIVCCGMKRSSKQGRYVHVYLVCIILCVYMCACGYQVLLCTSSVSFIPDEAYLATTCPYILNCLQINEENRFFIVM